QSTSTPPTNVARSAPLRPPRPAARIRPRCRTPGESRHIRPDGTPGPRPLGSQAMNIVVCVKQIPDPAMPGQLDPGTKTLKREGKLIMDESDSFCVEMGLQLAEKAGGGEVTIVSMVPAAGLQGIRSALAMGAARAILVSDDALAGTDALGTAKVLAAAIKRA